jgi:hypothetical protein
MTSARMWLVDGRLLCLTVEEGPFYQQEGQKKEKEIK